MKLICNLAPETELEAEFNEPQKQAGTAIEPQQHLAIKRDGSSDPIFTDFKYGQSAEFILNENIIGGRFMDATPSSFIFITD